MSAKLQQLFKSTQHKIDDLPRVRLLYARVLREQRMGFKAANVMIEAVARNVSPRPSPPTGFRFGCMEYDGDGKPYYPVYDNAGERIGKDYPKKNVDT